MTRLTSAFPTHRAALVTCIIAGDGDKSVLLWLKFWERAI